MKSSDKVKYVECVKGCKGKVEKEKAEDDYEAEDEGRWK